VPDGTSSRGVLADSCLIPPSYRRGDLRQPVGQFELVDIVPWRDDFTSALASGLRRRARGRRGRGRRVHFLVDVVRVDVCGGGPFARSSSGPCRHACVISSLQDGSWLKGVVLDDGW